MSLGQYVVFGALLGALPAGALHGAGCADDGGSPESVTGSASAVVAPAPLKVTPIAKPIEVDPNPLGLPPAKLDLPPGARVFTLPQAMLRGAKVGSSFVLRATTIVGKDGDNLVVDGRDGPDYEVHPSYVIAMKPGQRPRIEQPVIAEWAGTLRHGVVRRHVKDKIVVRFTDTGDKSERQLDLDQMSPQQEGFRPGNYAVHRKAGEHFHVLLVAPLGAADKAPPDDGKTSTEWLSLGFGGAAQIVPERELFAVPVRYDPKENANVWAVHLGKMRPGIVKSLDRPGLATVRFERAGRPVEVGWGLLMPPLRQ